MDAKFLKNLNDTGIEYEIRNNYSRNIEMDGSLNFILSCLKKKKNITNCDDLALLWGYLIIFSNIKYDKEIVMGHEN